jgi:hypothetical protein
MAEASADELRELVAGTWLGVACIVELLIDENIVSRDALKSLLSAGENRTHDHRRRAGIAGLRRLIDSGPASDPIKHKSRINRPYSSNDLAERRAEIKRRGQAELSAYYAMLSGQSG